MNQYINLNQLKRVIAYQLGRDDSWEGMDDKILSALLKLSVLSEIDFNVSSSDDHSESTYENNFFSVVMPLFRKRQLAAFKSILSLKRTHSLIFLPGAYGQGHELCARYCCKLESRDPPPQILFLQWDPGTAPFQQQAYIRALTAGLRCSEEELSGVMRDVIRYQPLVLVHPTTQVRYRAQENDIVQFYSQVVPLLLRDFSGTYAIHCVQPISWANTSRPKRILAESIGKIFSVPPGWFLDGLELSRALHVMQQISLRCTSGISVHYIPELTDITAEQTELFCELCLQTLALKMPYMLNILKGLIRSKVESARDTAKTSENFFRTLFSSCLWLYPDLFRYLSDMKADSDLIDTIRLRVEKSVLYQSLSATDVATQDHSDIQENRLPMESNLPSAVAPILLGILVDVSASMVGAIRNRTGENMSRLESFQRSLDDLVVRARKEISARLNAGDAPPDLRIFAYGFGFGNPLSFLLGGRGPAVRDLLMLPGQTYSTVTIQQLGDDWERYKRHVTELAKHMLGNTPMLEAFRTAQERFHRDSLSFEENEAKILFLLSDGDPTDDRPKGEVYRIAEALKSKGVTVVSCYVTDSDVADPRHLYGRAEQEWPTGAQLMFQCASVLERGSTFESYLQEYGWTMDEGARIFTQINQSEILSEFLNLVLSPLEKDKGRQTARDQGQRTGDLLPPLSALRRLLASILINDVDLDAFCVDYFPSVKRRFTGGMDRVAKENTLLERESINQILSSLLQAHGAAVAAYKYLLFHKGVGVWHPNFGAGRIADIQGEGDGIKLSVDFDASGRKIMLWRSVDFDFSLLNPAESPGERS